MFRILRYACMAALLATSARAETLVKDLSIATNGVDPADSVAWGTVSLTADLFEGLTSYDRDANVILAQAESHDVSADRLVHTFRLRPGMLWSDGTPITAHDYVFAARRIFDPTKKLRPVYALTSLRNASRIAAGELPPEALGIDAPDDMTVRLTLEGPVSYVPLMTLQAALYPVPRHVVETFGDAWTKPENFVGNGAYTLAEETPKGEFILRWNPTYRDAQNVHFKTVKAIVDQDTEMVEALLSAGELDIVTIYQGQRTNTWLREVLGARFKGEDATSSSFIVLNGERVPALADPRIREALSMAIFREPLIERALAGYARPAYSISPASKATGWSPEEPEWADWPADRRIETARRIIEDAGYVGENRLTFVIETSEKPIHRNVWNAVRLMWAEVGVETEVEILPADEYLSKLQDGISGGKEIRGALRSGFNLFYDTPMVIYEHIAKKMREGRYQSAESTQEIVDLIHRAAADLDMQTPETFRRIEDLIKEDAYLIPLVYNIIGNVEGPRVTLGKQNFNKLPFARHARPYSVQD